MAVTLDHDIIHARDKEQTARFPSGVLGLPAHETMGHLAEHPNPLLSSA